MEKCIGSKFSVKLIELNAGWSDLGTWGSVFSISKKNEDQNVLSGDIIAKSTSNSLIYSTSRLVATVGVNNLVVVETPDAVLILNRDQDQDIKTVVNQLDQLNREEKVMHRKVNRPWGFYDTIDMGMRFKVKRIRVNPGASLSLQKHNKRAEHWVVISGTAKIVNDDKVLMLNENQSTYIPPGAKHRLSNPGTIPLEIIEVQSGSYIEEDDIERFDDLYGRE